MSLFKSSKGFTTLNFCIGSPEAEAETTHKSKIRLSDVFEDFLEILPELNTEKFIVIGRKGSGKTALAEYLFEMQNTKPNFFCDFVKKFDVDIQKIVQVGKEKGTHIQEELLFKWIILTKILRLISRNEALQHLRGMKELKQFVKKNSGFIDIKSYEIVEVIGNEGFEVNIEYFKRFSSKFSRDLKLRGEKAPFYKLIPHLEETIIDLLSSIDDVDNKYFIIFDDLDIGFKATNKEHVSILIALLRIAKDYNINYFGKNGLDVKVVILLRDDIADVIRLADSDTAKIFSSYGILISWYEHEIYNRNENLLKIKQFINKRIEKNFIQNGIPLFSGKGAWSSLFQEDTTFYKESSFKYVLEHTFYKPRDFILFFLPISKFEFNIPLEPRNVNLLLGKYSKEAIDEVNNEFIAFLDNSEINSIFKILETFCNIDYFYYSHLRERIEQFSFTIESEQIINLLFKYSLIGNKDISNKQVYFKCREERSNDIKFNKDLPIILHYVVKVFIKNK